MEVRCSSGSIKRYIRIKNARYYSFLTGNLTPVLYQNNLSSPQTGEEHFFKILILQFKMEENREKIKR